MNINKEEIIAILRAKWPNLLAIYAFGSQVQGVADARSDLDLAILIEGYADPLLLWQVAQALANKINFDVDLVDLRAASTVMQYQVITTGERWWESDSQAALYECYILSEQTALNTLRADLLSDIQRKGKIYDR